MNLHLYARLTKVCEATRRVTGVIASESLDRAKEVFDYEASKPHFEKWSGEIAKATDGKSLGNVRAMHGKVAAGRVTEMVFDDAEKTITVEADIVDDNEWEKVTKGLYTGFSIGGRYVRKWTDDSGQKRYEAEPHEVSIVDLPANRDATFTVVKAAGATEEHHFDASVTVNEEGEGNAAAEGAEKSATTEDDAPEEGELRLSGDQVEKFVNGEWTALGVLTKAADPLSGDDEEELRKSAYSISALARLAEDCRYLADSRSYELWDGTGNRTVPDELKAACVALYDALLSVVSADVDKAKAMIAEKMAALGDEELLRKDAGFNAVLDSLGTLRKALNVEDNEGIINAFNKIAQENEDLRKRFDAAPADTKSVVRVVDKATDVELNKVTESENGTTATASDDASPEKKFDSSLRKALSSGVRMTGVGR